MIGDIVTVTIDRPLGSFHPKHKGLFCPINYGCVKGVPAPDGEEQDAYLLGVEEPAETFTGKVVAVIHRFDDIEEKGAVCPEGAAFSKEKIAEKVHSQEQYFRTEIIMEMGEHYV